MSDCGGGLGLDHRALSLVAGDLLAGLLRGHDNLLETQGAGRQLVSLVDNRAYVCGGVFAGGVLSVPNRGIFLLHDLFVNGHGSLVGFGQECRLGRMRPWGDSHHRTGCLFDLPLDDKCLANYETVWPYTTIGFTNKPK